MFPSPSLPYPSIIPSRRITPFHKRNELIQPSHPFNSHPLPSSLPTFYLAANTSPDSHPRARSSCLLFNLLRRARGGGLEQPASQDRTRCASAPSSSFRTFSISLVSFTLIFHLGSISLLPSCSPVYPHRSTSTLYSTRVCRAIYFRICHSVYCFLPLVYSK